MYCTEDRIDEARSVYLEAIERFSRVFGFCHYQSSGPIGQLQSMLRQAGDFTMLRDLNERWIREMLATPADTDARLAYRRSVRLSAEALDLVTLPASVPFDGSLSSVRRRRLPQPAVTGKASGASWGLSIIAWATWSRLSMLSGLQCSVLVGKRVRVFDFIGLALIQARCGERDQHIRVRSLLEDSQDAGLRQSADVLEAEARQLLALEPTQ